MANHKSTKKRIRSTKTRNEGNKYLHKTTRNAIKSLDGASSKDEKKHDILTLSCSEISGFVTNSDDPCPNNIDNLNNSTI